MAPLNPGKNHRNPESLIISYIKNKNQKQGASDHLLVEILEDLCYSIILGDRVNPWHIVFL